MINIESLTINYKNKNSIKNISLKINKGDIVALVGKNGAGKSTLLKTITGLLKPTMGNVEVFGSIGWMPESSIPDPILTIYEFISFSGHLKGISKDDLHLNVQEVLNLCELELICKTKCKDLSKGQKQRVLLASAIIGQSDILILDEPSAGLDPLFQKEMVNMITNLAIDKTIILSTHNISEIEKLATKIIVLKNGELSYFGNFNLEKSYYDYF